MTLRPALRSALVQNFAHFNPDAWNVSRVEVSKNSAGWRTNPRNRECLVFAAELKGLVEHKKRSPDKFSDRTREEQASSSLSIESTSALADTTEFGP